MTLTSPTALAVAALLVALVALAFALLAWRKADDARAQAHTHPDRGRRSGRVDERQANLGPPRLTGERRSRDDGPAARHRASDDTRARRADHDDPRWDTRPVDDARTTELPRIPPPGSLGLPPPGSIGRPRA